MGELARNKAANSKMGKKLQESVNEQKNIARGKTKKQGLGKDKANVNKAERKRDSYIFVRSATTSTIASGAGSTVYDKTVEKINKKNKER